MRRNAGWRWLLALTMLFGMIGTGLPARDASAQALGSIRIVIVKGDTSQRVPGACFGLNNDQAGAVLCDHVYSSESAGQDGLIVFGNIPPGTYNLTEILVPAGYKRMAMRSVTITAGAQTSITVRQWPGANTLRIKTVDANNALVPGGCYGIVEGAASPFLICDDMDGTIDGVVRTGGLVAGTHSVTQFTAPAGYFRNETTKTVTFSGAGGFKVQTWLTPKAPATARIVVTALKPSGAPLKNACYSLETPAGMQITYLCEGWDAEPVDGVLVFLAVRPGDYVLKLMNASTLGPYQVPAAKSVTKVSGTKLRVTFRVKAA